MRANDAEPAEHVAGYDLIAICNPKCVFCGGTGDVVFRRQRVEPFGAGGPRARHCDCVYKRAFHSCIRRYYESRAFGGLLRGSHSPEPVSRRIGKWPIPRAFRHAEYTADIEINARRALAGRPLMWAIWWYHVIHSRTVTDCIRLIRRDVGVELNRGTYFYELYQMELFLGRVFLELKPYGLYPADYFSNRGWIECKKQSTS